MEKFVVIGLGSMGKRHIANLKTLYPNAQILGVSSSGSLAPHTRTNADKLSTSIHDAIDFKPSLAVIASPATYHLPHAKQLLAANIPLLIEKPLTANSHAANELALLAKKAHVPVEVAYCLRYLPAARTVKNLLAQKQLGSVYTIYAHVGQYLPMWRPDKNHRLSVSALKKLGGGVLLELSHELDYLQWMVGELSYHYALLRHTKALDLEVEEIADLILTNQLGTVCSIHLNCIQKNTQRYCEFIGENASLRWDLLKNQVSLFLDDKEHLIFSEPSWDKNTAYILMLQHFIDRVEKQDTHNDLFIAQHTVTLIDRIKSSAVWGVTQ